MSSSDTNYVPNEHEEADKYDSYAISSKIMPYQSYPKSLVNQKFLLKFLLSYRVNELLWH